MNFEFLKTIKIRKDSKVSMIVFVIFILVAIVIYKISTLIESFNLAVVSITLVFMLNLWWACRNISKRYIFIGMNFMMFVFILSRPLISELRGQKWWYFNSEVIWKSLDALLISFLVSLLGSIVADKVKFEVEYDKRSLSKYKKSKKCIYLLELLTFLVYFSVEINKYMIFKNLDYSSIYENNSINYSIVVRLFYSLYVYMTMFIFAMMPKKREIAVVSTLYIISAVPSLLLGSRNDIVLRCIFVIVYYLFRHYYFKGDEEWILVQHKIIAVVVIPVAIISLGAYNYLRDDESIKNHSPFYMFVDFFYKQGTTYDTICQGFENEEKLKGQKHVISYTFGEFIDYALYNTISQKLFKTHSIGSGNSIEMATFSNSMAHHLSYIVLGGTYLQGHGRGTSFLIEVYMDFGWIGIVIYSFALGMSLILILKLCCSKNIIFRYISFTVLSSIWILPRYSATGFLKFIIMPQFWIIVVIVNVIRFIGEKIEMRKKYEE